MAVPTKRRATYQDILDAPADRIAEIVGGELRLSPRPACRATSVGSAIGGELYNPFGRGRGGPGGWLVVDEPEIHVADEILVPDLAGWRRTRLPVVPEGSAFTLAPDWICEVLSPSTERLDRAEKLPTYAAWGVGHAWLVHPRHRTVEVLRLHEGKWLTLDVHRDDQRVRAEPFDAIELELANLWADLPTRASEPAAEYAY